MVLSLAVVLACAVCGAADRTLPVSGAEASFDGRKRATLDLRAASFETIDRALRVVELRAEPGVAAAVSRDVMLGAEVPVLRRTLDREAGRYAGSTTAKESLGDIELRATYTAWRSAPTPVRRRLTLSTGLKLPTAPLERDPAGALTPPDLQPGCGSVVPLLGASYAWTSALWSAWASASLLFPVSVRSGAHPGDSLRGALGLQLQPTTHFATRLTASGRLDGTGELGGAAVTASGGTSMYLAPELVLSPTTDLVVSLGGSFPVVQAMRGYRATAPVLLASVGVDF